MSTPVQKNQDGADLTLHAPELPRTQPAQNSPSTVPEANGAREASRAPRTPPSLWRRAADAPPTAPEVRGDERPQPKPEATQLRPQGGLRMPQGLGGPNLAAPSGPLLPRVSHSAPPGVDGIDAVWPPRGQQAAEFEGDAAIKALRHRLSLDPELVPSPPIRRRSTSYMPAVGRLSLVVLVAGMVAGGVALLSFETGPDVMAMLKRDVFKRDVFNRDAGMAAAPLLTTGESTPAPAPPRLIVEG